MQFNMDYQQWIVYWGFRNGDCDRCTELLSMDPNHQFDGVVKGYYGDTLLHLACRNGWLDYVKFLLEDIGFDAEVKDCGLQTPLHYACRYGHLDIAQYLMTVHNCDFAVATRDHWTPLLYACRYGHLNIVKYIISIPGVTLNIHVTCKYSPNDKFLGLASKQGIHPDSDSQSTLLQIACSFNQVQIVQYLCKEHNSHEFLNDTDKKGLFILCCKHGLLEVVKQLGASVSHYVDAHGKLGLHYACQEGHISVAKYLIEKCDCDISKLDRNGCNPLHLACRCSCNTNMVKYILSKLKCIHTWNEALTLVLCEEQWTDSQCIDLIKLLVSTKEWLPNSRCNSNGDTILHLSVKYDRLGVAQFLLVDSKLQVDPNIRNTKEETPLKQASNANILQFLICQERVKLESDDEVVNRLLTGSTQEQDSVCTEVLKEMIKNRQWDPNSICNPKGDTALHLSARYHLSKTGQFLISEVICDPNRKNQDGATPLDLAADVEIISLLINCERVQTIVGKGIVARMLTSGRDLLHIDVLKTLLNLEKWDPNLSHNSEGDTALHLVARLHRPILAHFLLSELKCDPTVKNLKNETPIELIIQYCSDSECTDLIKQIITMNRWNPDSSCNSEDDTALHLSVWYHRQELTFFLVLDDGYLLYVKNKNGETPLSLLLSIPQWTESDCIRLMKPLIASESWDPNSPCDSENNTILHLAALYHRSEVAEFIISQAVCDPNIRNCNNETLLELLMPIWSDSECVSIIKSLIVTQNLDPNLKCSSENETALHLAARYHRPMVAHYLLSEKSNCDPNKKNHDGLTPLDLASNPEIISLLVRCERVQSKPGNDIIERMLTLITKEQESLCIDTIKALIEWNHINSKVLMTAKQWDLNSSSNSKHDTVLHLAVRYHRPKVVQFLLSEVTCDPNIKNADGWTILDEITASYRWPESSVIDIIESLIMTKEWDPNSSCNPNDDTVLHLAARYHRPKVVQFLLSEVKCDPNIKNADGWTVVFEMIASYRWPESSVVDIIKSLIMTKKWDPNSSCNPQDDTALHLAARYHRPKVVQFLLSEVKCDPNIKNADGQTILPEMTAFFRWVDSELTTIYRWSESSAIDIIKSLIMTKEWDPNSSCNPNGDTALHLAIRYNRPKVVQFLLSKVKCDPNIKNADGWTIVFEMIASYSWPESSVIGIIKSLIMTKEWDPNSSCNPKDYTALHLAAWYHRPMVAYYLLYENSNCDPNKKNHDGLTPLDLAINPVIINLLVRSERVQSKPGNDIIERILTNNTEEQESLCIDTIKALIECNSKVLMTIKQWDLNSSSNSKNETALHLAARYHRPKVVQFLLSEVKCDPNIKNADGWTIVSETIASYRWPESSVIDIIESLIMTKEWDPNSSCNPNDDTALHLAARYHRPKVVLFLLSEVKCDPNIKNADGWTIISEMTASDRWPESSVVDIIKSLIMTKEWDPNSSCNSNDDTVLHLAVRHDRPGMLSFLLSESKCDPNMTNKEGKTIIDLLISDSECIDVIQALIKTKHWDPNSSCNSRGDRALHLSVRYNRREVVHYLLSEAKCDPNMRNEQGETIIDLLISSTKAWSNSECIDVIKALIKAEHWDPNSSCNSRGDRALNLSAKYYRCEVLHYLLSEAKCDPNMRNEQGETIIALLISNKKTWSNSECIDVIKALIATKHWDPNSSCNSRGDRALHLSAKYDRCEVVHYLLSKAKCDPNSKNLKNEAPLQLATDTDIINDLIRHGANPDNVYKLYGKSLKLTKPLMPTIKVFIIGNSGVGKSTLTEALKIEVPLLARVFSTRKRVSDVDEKTAGIVPHDFESKKYGRVTLYDFAGHREFYSSHAAFLYNILQGSSPVFLLVVNISSNDDDIEQNILYWLSFVENQCSVVNCTTHVIVVGSHADIVISRGDDPQRKGLKISESIKRIFQSSVIEYTGICTMDCQYSVSSGMTKLQNCLLDICSSIRMPQVIPFNAHCFHVFLLDKFRSSVAVTVQEVENQIKEQKFKGIATFLPDTSTTIYKACEELSNRGHIVFLKKTINIAESWVIINKVCLLSVVTGTVFAPENFKQHCHLAESTGVVPLSRLVEYFPDIETDVLIGFLTHLEFYREILDSELLELIMKHHDRSLNAADTFMSDSKRYFLFPGLITLHAPKTLWEKNHEFKYHYAWILQCTNPNSFFSTRFLQVLLLRLAFSFALVKRERNEAIPAFQCKCSIWKNGIFWGEMFGMEVIIEVHPNNKTVMLQIRCREDHLLHCISQRSGIIRRILQCTQDFCPQIKIIESFINPSEATKFPIELTPQTPRFNVQTLAEAIIKFGDHYPLSVISSAGTILLDSLITFESYAEIGLSMLKCLYNDENDDTNKISDQVLEMLSHKLSRKANLFIKIFEDHQLPSPSPGKLLPVLKQWRDKCEGTYKCLKEKLDQYSIFAERNILELSGVPLQMLGDNIADRNSDDLEAPTCARIDISATPNVSADMCTSEDVNSDKSFQELSDHDNLDEEKKLDYSLPTYGTATRTHELQLSAATGLSPIFQDSIMDMDKSIQLPGYDEIDEDKAILPLPTYETATNSENLKIRGHYNSSEKCDIDIEAITLFEGTAPCASAIPKLHQLDYLEGNGKKVKLIDAAAAVWDKVALRLHFKRHDIATIARDHHQQSVLAATKVFSEWLDGKGRQPPSWAVLIQALKETDSFPDVVNDLKCILDISNDLITHDEPQKILSSSCKQSQSVPRNPSSNATKSTTRTRVSSTHELKEQTILEGSTDLPQPDHKPKLLELQLLMGRSGRKVKVIEGVGDGWKELARSLDFSEARIDSIDTGASHEQPEEACQEMFAQWLDGDDLRGPVTWDTLVQSMIEAGLVDMAEQLKELVSYS